ncbi:MAG TPA: sulfatase-like hydrolase/transferase [Vicinamibacteria bacterium]|nr:sulfatase-like hydrolase/transferase [Vicinamibacteria bacterium]
MHGTGTVPLLEVAGILAADLLVGIALALLAELVRRVTGPRPALRHLSLPVLLAALFAARGRGDILVLTDEGRWVRAALALVGVLGVMTYVRLGPQRRERAWSVALVAAGLLGGAWFVLGNVHLRAATGHLTATPLAMAAELVAFLLVLLCAARARAGGTWAETAWAGAALPVAIAFALLMTPRGPRLETRGAPSGAATRSPSVVLLVMDTVRRDRLGLYGYRAATSPHLDALSREAVVFDRAYASSTYSLPSHASLLSGLPPSAHGARPAGDPGDVWVGGAPHHPLDAGVETLAERLAARGYRTGGVVGNSVFLADWTGLSRGFQAYACTPRRGYGYVPLVRPLVMHSGLLSADAYPYAAHWPADRLVDVAIGWLSAVDERPFFLFMNLMDAHAPYAWHGPPFGRDDSGRYDSSIRFADAQIHRLLEAVRERGRFDDTVVVVTADHGELFGEKGRTGHPAFLYEAMLRVPLLLRLPGGRAGRVARPLALHHVASLIEHALEGARTAEAVTAGLPPEPVLLAENWRRERETGRVVHERAVYAGALKLVVRGDRPHQLFDVAADPAEEHDLFATRKDAATAIAGQMMAAVTPGTRRGTAPPLDPEMVERLRSLGYGGGR